MSCQRRLKLKVQLNLVREQVFPHVTTTFTATVAFAFIIALTVILFIRSSLNGKKSWYAILLFSALFAFTLPSFVRLYFNFIILYSCRVAERSLVDLEFFYFSTHIKSTDVLDRFPIHLLEILTSLPPTSTSKKK